MKMLDEKGISAELRSIIENSEDIVFVKNRAFQYLAASKRYVFECLKKGSIEEIRGQTDFDLFENEAIAKKTCMDEETLLTSGKTMMEFLEDFEDSENVTHSCRVTKFLLHDQKGQAAAIFSQCYDVDESVQTEVMLKREMDHKITEAVNSVFYASYFIDLKTGSFTILKGADYARSFLSQCTNIYEAIEQFVLKFVQPEDQEKMRAFCEVDTIAERLGSKTHIDCDYRGAVAKGWCQTSILPVAYDGKGNVTHVLFVLSRIDQNRARDLDEGLSLKKDMEVFFDVVQSGIVEYEWDGKDLHFVTANQKYIDWFGYKDLKKGDTPAYAPIHPDDIKEYQKAINDALLKTHKLVHVFRIFDAKRNKYRWLQINAIDKPNSDGTSLVYAIFTDITKQAEASSEIAKKQASLISALDAADQLCCEYDPLLHTVKSLTDRNFFSLPATLSHFPECLKDYDLIHPDDLDLFLRTVHSSDDGKQEAHCDVRGLVDGSYRWYACRFKPYFDAEKNRYVVFMAIIDATMRIESMENYKRRLRSLEKANEDALCMCDVNVTKNRFTNVQGGDFIQHCAESVHTLDEAIRFCGRGLLDEEEREEYLRTFSSASLLKRFEQGETHICFEHFYRTQSRNTKMVATMVDLIKEPVTGDVVGILYAKDQNDEKVARILLNAALGRDYPALALIYADTEEYYLYEPAQSQYCTHKQKYWSMAVHRLRCMVDEQEQPSVCAHLNGTKIVAYLNNHESYAYAYYAQMGGKRCRLEASFRYVDRKHKLLMASLRNITDEDLILKYKFESEHDSLTGLLNRNTVFRQSRALLEEYPMEQFVMLHIDVRHFHLYNTFFSEAAGDRLLKKIADVLTHMADDIAHVTYGRMEADVFCVFFALDPVLFEKHVRQCFESLQEFSPDFPLDLAVGAYWVQDPSMSMEAMFSRATIAAKSHVINLFGCISKYDEDMERNLIETQKITSEMVNAIEQEQFEVYLQPKFALRSGRMVGAEALVRWRHPERGLVPPSSFVPIFEQNGFIAKLDCYMWEHVCAILQRWKKEGIRILPVSVNLSRVSLYSHATVPFLKSLIEKYDLDPSLLELELTESAYMDEPEELKRMLKELQEYGFKILMDDFGSGYSSLNTLRDLPVDILKLDMKFLSMPKDDARGNAVLSSVARMSKLLRLPIVAEGVETREQAEYLTSIGCEYAQGYLFARPMSVVEYEKCLNTVPIGCEESSVQPVDEEVTINPSAVLEVQDKRFLFVRANRIFLEEFDMIDNLDTAAYVFLRHLDEENSKKVLHALKYSVEVKEDVTFRFTYNKDSGCTRTYQCYLRCRGTIENLVVLSMTCMKLSDVHEL